MPLQEAASHNLSEGNLPEAEPSLLPQVRGWKNTAPGGPQHGCFYGSALTKVVFPKAGMERTSSSRKPPLQALGELYCATPGDGLYLHERWVLGGWHSTCWWPVWLSECCASPHLSPSPIGS